jgi:hypothetical protein
VKTLFLAAGWILIGVAALLAVAMHRADRRMQGFRAPGAPSSAFLMVPLRWRRELYTAEGRALVGRAWRLTVMMYVVALAGMFLVSMGVEALP